MVMLNVALSQQAACCKVVAALVSKYSCKAWEVAGESLRAAGRALGRLEGSTPCLLQRQSVVRPTFKQAEISATE